MRTLRDGGPSFLHLAPEVSRPTLYTSPAFCFGRWDRFPFSHYMPLFCREKKTNLIAIMRFRCGERVGFNSFYSDGIRVCERDREMIHSNVSWRGTISYKSRRVHATRPHDAAVVAAALNDARVLRQQTRSEVRFTSFSRRQRRWWWGIPASSTTSPQVQRNDKAPAGWAKL